MNASPELETSQYDSFCGQRIRRYVNRLLQKLQGQNEIYLRAGPPRWGYFALDPQLKMGPPSNEGY